MKPLNLQPVQTLHPDAIEAACRRAKRLRSRYLLFMIRRILRRLGTWRSEAPVPAPLVPTARMAEMRRSG